MCIPVLSAKHGAVFSTNSLSCRGFNCSRSRCTFVIAAEQKARVSYDNILRLIDDPDVCDPIRFLRQRELVHYQRFGEALRIAQDNMDYRNFYGYNPEFDRAGTYPKRSGGNCGCSRQ